MAAKAAEQPGGATLDDFDALCAHLATMHPSRYLTLIEGVRGVYITGVHPIDDQNVALRLVALTDRLYDAGIPVVASGAKLDTIFSEEMLAGGYRKKYLRATSRLLALTSPGGFSSVAQSSDSVAERILVSSPRPLTSSTRISTGLAMICTDSAWGGTRALMAALSR